MRELVFDGWWEGDVEFTCDNCGKTVKFRFDDEESARNVSGQRNALRHKRNWRFDRVNGTYVDACSEKCRIEYIKKHTF